MKNKLFLIVTILAIILSSLLTGCTSSNEIVPMKDVLGSKLELKSVVSIQEFEEIQIQIGNIPPDATNGLGYHIARYNSKEFMHERFWQNEMKIPATTPFLFQLNKKAIDYVYGKYGILPPGIIK
jgi:hypothetical protein